MHITEDHLSVDHWKLVSQDVKDTEAYEFAYSVEETDEACRFLARRQLVMARAVAVCKLKWISTSPAAAASVT